MSKAFDTKHAPAVMDSSSAFALSHHILNMQSLNSIAMKDVIQPVQRKVLALHEPNCVLQIHLFKSVLTGHNLVKTHKFEESSSN